MRKITGLYASIIFVVVFTVNVTAQNIQNGILSAFAGTGKPGFSGDGGPALLAQLDSAKSIAIDKYGNMYVVDAPRIRKINTAGIMTTIAGNGMPAFTGDGGPASAAQFAMANAIAVDDIGNIYIADSNRVRKINTSGIISTIAGSNIEGYSGDGGIATLAELNHPSAITVDGSGNVYIADSWNNCVRKINTGGIISTYAGNGLAGYSGDGIPANTTKLRYPWGLALDGTGNLYIADEGNARIRKVNTSGIITTIAGNGTSGYYGDGGPATSAELYDPEKISFDHEGNLLILDGSTLRKINFNTGQINFIAGRGVDGDNGGYAGGASIPASDIAISASDDIYVAEQSRYDIKK